MTNRNNIKGHYIQNKLLAFTSLTAQTVLINNTLAPIQLPVWSLKNYGRDFVSMCVLKERYKLKEKKKEIDIYIILNQSLAI